MRLWLTLAALLLLPCLAMAAPATYYIDYASGADANAGTSTGAAWKRHPYMIGFTGSYSHSAGDSFIFKGGVVWPSSCFDLTTIVGGTGVASDYYGVSSSYFSGASWTKPIWDASGKPLNTMANSCMVLFEGSYVTLDSIVFTNLNWSAAASVYAVNMFTSSGIIVTNCEFRSFTNIAPGLDNLYCIFGNTSAPHNPGSKATHCTFSGRPSSTNIGTGIYYCETVEYCVFSDLVSGLIGICQTNAYNIVHDIGISIDPAAHNNALYQMMPPDLFSVCHHNTITNNSSGELLYITLDGVLSGHTATNYCYDNLVVNNAAVISPIVLDPANNSQGTTGVIYIWNNTLQTPDAASACIRVAKRTGTDWNIVTVQNDHLMTDASTPIALDLGTLATLVADHNLTQTLAQATSSGYTNNTLNVYFPSSVASPTVDVGTNGLFASDIRGIARPQSAAWDIGAYEYVNPDNIPRLHSGLRGLRGL